MNDYMEQREKLIELISPLMLPQNAFLPTTAAEYLIEHGVVVLPCRCAECKDSIGINKVLSMVKPFAYEAAFNPSSKLHDFYSYGERKGGDE